MPKRSNDGIKKICGCPRRLWTKCPHPWHFGFCYGRDATGKHVQYRFSLHRYDDKPRNYIMAKGEAERLRDRARTEIRAGHLTPQGKRITVDETEAGATLDHVVDEYLKRHIRTATRRPGAKAKIELMLDNLVEAPLASGHRLGGKSFKDITRADLNHIFDQRLQRIQQSAEALRQVRELEERREPVPRELQLASALARRAGKGGIVSLNRFKGRVRHLFNWSIGHGWRDDTPFKRHGVTVIKLDTRVEHERTRRLAPGEEDRLLAHATPHLRAVVTAALSTGCRIGELLSLQWSQVRLDAAGSPRYFELTASKTKTGEARLIPISSRLRAVLDMRRTDPGGEQLPVNAYVFGNEVGERTLTVRGDWERACHAGGIVDLHVHDLRREFACRLLEGRAELHDVRAFLGHANITTTSKYLRSTPIRMEKALGLIDTQPAAPMTTLEAENEALRARLAALEAQLGQVHNPFTSNAPDADDVLHVEDSVTPVDSVN
jgi:integrase